MNINHGPFKGVTPAADELKTLFGYDGSAVERDGQPVQVFALQARTQHFLEVFSPLEGWGVEIECGGGPFDLPDPNTWDLDGNMVVQPTLMFTARLKDKSDRIVASATYCKVVNSVSSVSEGESSARGRLYDALGLPGSIQGDSNDVVRPSAPVRSQPPIPTIEPVESSPNAASGPSKLPQEIVDIIKPSDAVDQPEAASAPVVIESSSQTDSHGKTRSNIGVVSMPQQAKKVEASSYSKAENGEPLNVNLVRQAIARASMRGVVFPESFASAKALNEFYRELTASTAKA